MGLKTTNSRWGCSFGSRTCSCGCWWLQLCVGAAVSWDSEIVFFSKASLCTWNESFREGWPRKKLCAGPDIFHVHIFRSNLGTAPRASCRDTTPIPSLPSFRCACALAVFRKENHLHDADVTHVGQSMHAAALLTTINLQRESATRLFSTPLPNMPEVRGTWDGQAFLVEPLRFRDSTRKGLLGSPRRRMPRNWKDRERWQGLHACITRFADMGKSSSLFSKRFPGLPQMGHATTDER